MLHQCSDRIIQEISKLIAHTEGDGIKSDSGCCLSSYFNTSHPRDLNASDLGRSYPAHSDDFEL